jgi:ribosome-associated protein
LPKTYYMEFKLNGQEYIQLNDLLKVLSLVGTGGEAKIRILTDEVFLNGEVCNIIRKKLYEGDVVHFGEMEILVIA